MNLSLVYDLTEQPFAIGDLIMFQQASLIVRAERKAEKIDVTLVIDPANPAIAGPRGSVGFNRPHALINSGNYREHLEYLTPALQVNQYLGEVRVMTKRDYERQPEDWPPKGFLYYGCWKMMLDCHKRGIRFEAISAFPRMWEWTRQFVISHGWAGQGLITVQLRRSVGTSKKRNSDYPEWIEFFRAYPDTQFVIVCAPSEVDDSLRLPNVTIACDTIGQDTHEACALVEGADIHLGMASGLAQMRMYSDKPYAIWREGISMPGMIMRGDQVVWPWTTGLQRMITGPETALSIAREFERLKDGLGKTHRGIRAARKRDCETAESARR